MEKVIQKEVTFREWFSKITERMTIISLSIKEKINIRDEDWEVLEALHGFYFMGHLPISRGILINVEDDSEAAQQTNDDTAEKTNDITAEQTTLFTSNNPQLFSGTKVETTAPITKKKKKNE